MHVGVVGLGQMGGRAASALVRAGHGVTVFDLATVNVQRAVAEGAHAAQSAAQVAAASEVVLLSLPGPAEVRDSVTGSEGVLAGGHAVGVVVDLSTIDPTTTADLADRAGKAGVDYMDAPILGRPQACGRWTLPVGGSQAAVDAARPALQVIAAAVVHVGGPGAGHLVKLLNNLMYGAINAVTAEVFAACDHAGIDPAVFYDAVAHSDAATASNLFREIGRKIVNGDHHPVFTVALLAKDTALGIDALERAGSPAILSRTVAMLNQLAQLQGLGQADTSALTEVYRALAATGRREGS